MKYFFLLQLKTKNFIQQAQQNCRRVCLSVSFSFNLEYLFQL